MKAIHTCYLATALLISACGGNAVPDGTNVAPNDPPSVKVAVQCDPVVGEFRDLMADYEAGLKEMVAAKKVDAARQEEWGKKAQALSKKVNERGERELGLRCWQEFNTISQTYAPRIAKLSMELAVIEAGDKMDPAALEAMKKAMGQ